MVRRLAILLLAAACQRTRYLPPPPNEGGTELLLIGTQDARTPDEIHAFDLSLPYSQPFEPDARLEALVFRESLEELGVPQGWRFDEIDGRAPTEFTAYLADVGGDPPWVEVPSRWAGSVRMPPLGTERCPDECAADQVCLQGRCADAVVDIEAAGDHACARWASGRVSCWGYNRDGAVGQAQTEALVATAREVDGIDDAEQLSVGQNNVCVQRAGGRIFCWGDDHQGPFLDPPRIVQRLAEPRAIEGIENAIGVSVGRMHECALEQGGTVACWGFANEGHLGDPMMTESSGRPLRVQDLDDAVSVQAGNGYACARREGDLVDCWGKDDAHQLGAVDGRGLDVGDDHACVIVGEDATVRCWGENGLDRIGGNGAPELPDRARSLGLGAQTSCAVLERGTVACWGGSRWGELQKIEPVPFSSPIPVVMRGLPLAIDVADALDFACTLGVDRSVWCWGSNRHGQLGNGESGILLERHVQLRKRATRIAAGGEFTCAIIDGGDVECWGHDEDGHLGRGERRLYGAPGRVELSGPAIDIDAGRQQACALIEGGDVYCWGENDQGQAVPGGGSYELFPVRVIGGAKDLAMGNAHSCAVLETGEVACWGVGFPSGTQILPLLAGVASAEAGHDDLEAGTSKLCYVRDDRTAACAICSVNPDRILECVNSDPIPGVLNDVDQIAVGYDHACVRSGGTVRCYGSDNNRQLGGGGLTALTDVRELMRGGSFTCAIVGDQRELWCWGDNRVGQLNDGTWSARTGPVRVPGLAGVVQGEGSEHACVATDAGRVECWGWNEWGQASTASVAIAIDPVRVIGLEPVF